MGTDQDWEFYGATRPYYGVLTDERFDRAQLDAQTKQAFFDTGERGVAQLFALIERSFGQALAPHHALDFGCGVGRILIPLAARCQRVSGLDVSPSMLREAEANCRARGIDNVSLLQSDDRLSQLRGPFDFVHSSLVFQHIPPARGKRLYSALIDGLVPGGYGALQLTYEKERRWGALRELAKRVPYARKVHGVWSGQSLVRPTMHMHSYQLGWLVKELQLRGVTSVRLELSRQQSSLAAYLIFRK